MYYSTNPDARGADATGRTANKTLTRRDINTIALLYKLDADVRNDTTAPTAQTRTYFDWYEQGLKAQTGNRPDAAMTFYRRAIAANGRLPEAKFNLGALLINEGNRLVRLNQLEAAQRHFAEATQLYADVLQSPNPPDSARENLAIARSNLALVSGALGRK
jgi:tetratricopeptide (TPR) repeat protein